MSLAIVNLPKPSYATYFSCAAAIGIPWIFTLTRSQKTNPPNPHWRQRQLTSLLLLFHTFYILYTLLIRPPVNIFTYLNITSNTPTDSIRSMLLNRCHDNILPEHLQHLLGKFGLLQFREYYVRFGHNVLTFCEHCQDFNDYALYALPRPILTYIREAAFIGFITIRNSRRESLRTVGLTALTLAWAFEEYFTLTAPVHLPNFSESEVTAPFMLHDVLHNLRHILFLLLPIFIFSPLPGYLPPFLRPSSFSGTLEKPSEITQALVSIQQSMEAAVTALHTLKYTRASLMRNPSLRARAADWWDEEVREGEWIKEDENVQNVAKSLGTGFEKKGEGEGEGAGEEGKLRTSAKMAMDVLKEGFVPSHFWLSTMGHQG